MNKKVGVKGLMPWARSSEHYALNAKGHGHLHMYSPSTKSLAMWQIISYLHRGK